MVFENAVFIKPNIELAKEFSFENSAPIFRKKFTLDSVKDAKLYVCGLGMGYYYINGKKVSDDIFSTPFSNYMKTLWYNEYDVSSLLNVGENVITVFLGNGFFNETLETKTWNLQKAMWRDVPKVILRLEADKKTVLVSDDSFRCLPNSATYFNQIRRGEYFDANLYDEAVTSLCFDDSEWQFARKDYTSPTGVFRKNECPPVQECEVLNPVNVQKTGDKKYLFDMGKNISGYIRLKVCGTKGDTLTIRYAEEITDTLELEYNHMDIYPSYCQSEGFQTDKFICSGKEITWSPMFTYHGFRYMEIDGIADIDAAMVQAVFVHQVAKRKTEFRCSDEILNQLFEAGINSTYSNMFYTLTDCPTREKMAWTNDFMASMEQLMLDFECVKLLEKCQQDNFDAMLKDGSLPGIIPSAGWWYSWDIGPIGDGILFEIPYRIYLHTGDDTLLKKSFPYFEKHFQFIESKKDEAGLTHYGLGDWSPPVPAFHDWIDFNEVPLINAAFEYYFYQIAALVDGETYEKKAEQAKRFVIDTFLEENGRCKINKQCSVALLIDFGLYDNITPLKKQLTELLESHNNHLYCGMVGIRHLFHALNKCGMPQLAYRVLTADGHPGYKSWIDNGATTLYERWEPDLEYSSHNHHMFSDFMSWMIKTMAGISIPHIGELSYEVNPVFLPEIDYVTCSYESYAGNISVQWNKTEQGIHLVIEKEEGVVVSYHGEFLTECKSEFFIEQ